MRSAEYKISTDLEEDHDDALPPGTELLNGQYIIDGYLSSGGFGITYHARDSLDRRVVIKECYPEALCCRRAKTVRARSSVNLNEFQSLVEMFVREARSIAKLNNPNIVGVHQVFEDNETAYMALDLIEGRDLLCVMEDKSHVLSPETIVGLLRKLLNAIATVHAEDMLHRDISPDNILLDNWGNPILIDFGAAREQASKKSRAISAMLVVKDGYSPQEFYISGSQQGPWSDLYSLAATFHHLIAKEPPPNSQNRLAALASKRPDPYPRLAGRIEGYDDAFLRAIDQAMQVFPRDRIQSAKEWLAMMETGQVRAVTARKRHRDAELLKVVSSLVDEVDRVLVQELDLNREPHPELAPGSAAEDVAVAEQSGQVERQWEYLPPEERSEPDEPAPGPTEPRLWLTRFQERDALRLRQRKTRRTMRRRSVLVVVCALAFAIIEMPPDRLASLAPPELSHLLDLGRDWTARTATILSLQL